MKFNWGIGILLAIITFVVAGIVFIIFAFSFDVNLVQEEYYKKGVDYQQDIDANKRSVNFKDSVKILQEEEFIKVVFGDNFNNLDSGLVHFYRPSDRFKDLIIDLQKDNDELSVDKNKLQYGRYIIEITWYKDSLKYYLEKDLMVK